MLAVSPSEQEDAASVILNKGPAREEERRHTQRERERESVCVCVCVCSKQKRLKNVDKIKMPVKNNKQGLAAIENCEWRRRSGEVGDGQPDSR